MPIIVNLAGVSPEENADLAKKAENAGADMIELPTHCPHFAENIEAQTRAKFAKNHAFTTPLL